MSFFRNYAKFHRILPIIKINYTQLRKSKTLDFLKNYFGLRGRQNAIKITQGLKGLRKLATRQFLSR